MPRRNAKKNHVPQPKGPHNDRNLTQPQPAHRDPTSTARPPAGFAIPYQVALLLRLPGMRHLLLDLVEYHGKNGLEQLRRMAPFVDVTRMLRDMRVQMALFSAEDADYFTSDLLMLDNVQACLAGGEPMWERASPMLREGCGQIHQFLLAAVQSIPDEHSATPAAPLAPGARQQHAPAHATPAASATKAPAPTAKAPGGRKPSVWCDVDMFFGEAASLGKLLRSRGFDASESSLGQLARAVRTAEQPRVFVFYSMDYVRNCRMISDFVAQGGFLSTAAISQTASSKRCFPR